MPRLALAACLCLLPAGAFADADAILADGAKLCAAQDNGTFGSEGAVKQVDLTGDGKPDTVVDEALFTCSTAASLFNGGTGGSTVHFIVDGTEQSYLVQGWDTANWANRQLVLLALHGSNCNATGADPCFEALVWGGRGFLSVRPPQN